MATRTAIINVMAKACYKASQDLLRDFGEVDNFKPLARAQKTSSRPLMKSLKKLLDELCFARPDYGE